MDLLINLPEEEAKQGIIALKNYLDKASIDGLETNEIVTSSPQNGQMGIGVIFNSIAMVIEAAEKPLTELVICLQKFVDNYRTQIKIPTKNGVIEISHGRSTDSNKIKELVVAILESSSKSNDKS